MEPNLRKKLTVALVVLAVPLTGGVAYALADSIDTQPDSEVIIPSGSRQPAGTTSATAGTTPDSTGATVPTTPGSTGATVPTTPGTTGATVPTTPATVDDHGGDVPVIAEQPPATVDDHGRNRGPGGGGDDGPGDDHGDRSGSNSGPG